MNKTVKKLEGNLVRALTSACEQAKVDVSGFEWLTHTADYANFPNSLIVRCIFDDDSSLTIAKDAALDTIIITCIHKALLNAGILLKNPKKHVLFDTEQACEREHQGNWKKRIRERH
ncbi:MAG: hypothetical protein ACJAVV_002830 [Alphaproteobacteria bacterium]|jgi:hypothetical protein